MTIYLIPIFCFHLLVIRDFNCMFLPSTRTYYFTRHSVQQNFYDPTPKIMKKSKKVGTVVGFVERNDKEYSGLRNSMSRGSL